MTGPEHDSAPPPPPAGAEAPRENTLLHWIVFIAMMSAIIGAGYLFVP